MSISPWIKKFKLPLLLIINMLPFALGIMLYPLGSMFDMGMFPPVYIALTFINYLNIDKTLHYVAIQLYVLVCMAASGCISTYLYYHNISNDYMTPPMGMLMVFFGAVIIIAVTAITGFSKRKNNQNKTEY